MSKPKFAALTAASIGMVLTQSSSIAKNQDTSAPQRVTEIAAPIDLDEEFFYSALPDEVLEKAAGFGATVHLAAQHLSDAYPTACLVGGGCLPPAKKGTAAARKNPQPNYGAKGAGTGGTSQTKGKR